MKKLLNILFPIVLITALVSCSDEFTEEDAMKALQDIGLQIAVIDASNSNLPLPGAQVKITINNQVVTETTDTNGVAYFDEIEIGGNINVYASKNEYTTSFTSVNTVPNDYRQTVVSTNIYLYSTTGANIVTVKGKVTAETDLTNREREKLEGVTVVCYNSSLSGATRNFAATTDNQGMYSIAVPVNSQGNDDLYVYFPTLEMQRTAAENKNNKYLIETKTASYSPSNYSETDVVQVPSAYLMIDAPAAGGTNFSLQTKVVPANISSQLGSVYIFNGGSGYGATGEGAEKDTFDFSAGMGDVPSQIIFNVVDGVITSYSGIIDNDEYTSKPSINFDGGTGAVIDFRHSIQYKVYIANGGSGYLSYPNVGVEYYNYNNGVNLEKEIDPDISGSNEIAGTVLFSNTVLKEGEIISYSGNGDTLFTTNYLASAYAPGFIYSDNTSEPAFGYINASSINSDSTLSGGYAMAYWGSGYDPMNPPMVTVTGLAGFGRDSEWKAEVNSSGAISQLIMIKAGMGFTDDVNDYDDDANYSEQEDADMFGFTNWSTGYGYHNNVRPGMTYTGDVFYGTGIVTE